MNPLAPQRSAWNTYSSISKVVRMRLSEIAQTVDRAVIISAGRLRFDGPLSQMARPGAQQAGRMEQAFLRLTADADQPDITASPASPTPTM
jgi:hypothetical protein